MPRQTTCFYKSRKLFPTWLCKSTPKTPSYLSNTTSLMCITPHVSLPQLKVSITRYQSLKGCTLHPAFAVAPPSPPSLPAAVPVAPDASVVSVPLVEASVPIAISPAQSPQTTKHSQGAVSTLYTVPHPNPSHPNEHGWLEKIVNGGLGHPQLTVTVASITHAAVTHVLQISVVDTAAGHPDTMVGVGVRFRPGDTVLASDDVMVMVACCDDEACCGDEACCALTRVTRPQAPNRAEERVTRILDTQGEMGSEDGWEKMQAEKARRRFMVAVDRGVPGAWRR